MRRETEAIRHFYDSFAWQKDERGVYREVLTFVDTRPVLDWYSHATHMRVKPFFGRGRYFLDAGSGPVANPEYLEYSSGYERRVCVDFSGTALKEARSKLQDKGWYVLADLAHLPFRDGAFDATVSAHVLYHVPEEQQQSVILELHRTMAPRGVCVIIYSQFTNLVYLIPTPFRRLIKMLRLPLRYLRRLKHRDVQREDANGGRSNGTPSVYAYAHSLKWFQVTMRGWNVDIRSWRSVDPAFTRRFVPDNPLGRLLLRLIFLLETLFPHALSRIGYQMIVIRKE